MSSSPAGTTLPDAAYLTLEAFQRYCAHCGGGPHLYRLSDIFGSVAAGIRAYFDGRMDQPMQDWMLLSAAEQISATALELTMLQAQSVRVEFEVIKRQMEAMHADLMSQIASVEKAIASRR